MSTHLELVREFHRQFGIAQPEYPETAHLADMDIVMRQALLMQAGQDSLHAIVVSDMAKLLAGLVDLAYNALAAIACRGDDLVKVPVNWRQDGSVLSVAKALSERIHNCHSGETRDYSALYYLCQQLAMSFINADFDGAFRAVHQDIMQTTPAAPGNDYAHSLARETLPTPPDLTDNLYE